MAERYRKVDLNSLNPAYTHDVRFKMRDGSFRFGWFSVSEDKRSAHVGIYDVIPGQMHHHHMEPLENVVAWRKTSPVERHRYPSLDNRD